MTTEETTTQAVRALTAPLQELAERELNEVPSRLNDDIQALRSWIEKQPHFRARTDDQFLLAFLRGSKFSLEKAKKKIDRFYTLRSLIPEIYNAQRTLDDPMTLEIVRLGILLQIPLPAEEAGPSITIIRACSYDVNKYKFADILRVGTMFGDIMMLEDDNSTVCGYVEILDMTNISAAHFFQLQPELLRKCATFADEAMPMRQRGTHFINVPPAFAVGFDKLKNFFPPKAVSRLRISVASEPDSIHNLVSRKYLPAEYGGESGTIQDIVQRMECKLLKYREFFEEELNYGADEKYREESLTNCDTIFGIDGSFRKLDID